MKPHTLFNLERAKAGDPVETESGKPVRLICFDAKGSVPILGLIEVADKMESAAFYSEEGIYASIYGYDPTLNLRMKAPEPKTIMLGDREVSAPIRSVYNSGDLYWFVTFTSCDLVGYTHYHGTGTDKARFKHGIVRRTEQEAKELAIALLEVLNG